jgi:isoquinoline 1-oxidoreductase subunit beta
VSGTDQFRVTRRAFVVGTTSSLAGLVLSFHVPEAAARRQVTTRKPLPPANAFLRIASDDTVTVLLAHSEMGQGIWTSLAMLIAEELECDWANVRCEHAPAAAVYAAPGVGLQVTGGSTTTTLEFERYRTVGAAAKDMLLRAAAARWKVSPAKLAVEKGVIKNGVQTLRYGELAAEAMKLSPPVKVKLKDSKQWTLLGKPTRRLDSLEKVTGKATFGIDVGFAGLRTAVVLRPPAFGAKLVRFDAAAARNIPGVEKIVALDNGIAVVAKHFWAAKLGRDALVAEWRKPEGGGADSSALVADYRKRAQTPGAVVASARNVTSALAAATRTHAAEYDVPYLAHAPMETLNCTVKIDGDRCEIWTGTQFQSGDQAGAAKLLGTTIDKVQIHTTFLGGGFGRRAVSDFVMEAVRVAKAAGVPVKVVWTREDDIRGGFYRPLYVHRVHVGVDSDGKPVAWDHVVVGQSIMGTESPFAGVPQFAAMVRSGIDHTSIEGTDSPYVEAVPARRVTLHTITKTSIPVWSWRSVGNTHTAFAVESMIDELAHLARRDPLDYRLGLLEKKPRIRRALELAAEKAGWRTPPPAGRARGLAVHESFGSIVAEVAEVSLEAGRIRVHAVTCAVDCGTPLNPLGIEAQMQSAICFGLSAALYGRLTISAGQVQESNYHDYPVVRMFEMPKVSVHVIHSGAPMGGIGEPAVAPVAPAVANAVFALTQKRLRTLPLRLG